MMTDKPRVLISDDDAALAAVLCRFAREAGFEATADLSSEVVEVARRLRPDLIVLDMSQRVDGRDLLSQLKRDPQTRDCQVVVLSGVEDQFTRHTCFELGAVAYETKPFDPAIGRKLMRLLRPQAAELD